MKRRRRVSPIVVACCLFGGGPAGLPAYGMGSDAAATPCEQAGIAAEKAAGLPSGILLAIGRVESGRWDSMRGRVTAWPWTINAAGKGQWFANKDAAAITVKTLLDGGTRSIDVGCFQINLMWHPGAFGSIDQAFDPDANARYAAAFLLSLYGRTGSWESAVAAYHSADPAQGFAYRQQVWSTWMAAAPVTIPVRTASAPMLASVSRPEPAPMPAVFAGVSVWTPMPPGTAGEVVAMPPPPATAGLVPPPLPVVTYHAPPRTP